MKKIQNRITLLMSLRICLYILLLALGSCSSCRKEVDALPSETQTGANTFGCLVNGQAWIPNGGGGFSGIKAINGGYLGSPIPNDPRHKNRVQIRTYMSNGTSTVIYIKNVGKTGIYLLNFNTIPDPVNIFPENNGLYQVSNPSPTPDESYITTSQVVGSVNITTADTINKIVAGTFEFDAIDINSNKKIRVSNGRFDINTKTLNR